MLYAVTPPRASPSDRRFLASGCANSEINRKSSFLMTAEVGIRTKDNTGGHMCQVGCAHLELKLIFDSTTPLLGPCFSGVNRVPSLRCCCLIKRVFQIRDQRRLILLQAAAAHHEPQVLVPRPAVSVVNREN